MSSILMVGGGQVEIVEFRSSLAAGSLAECRAKFAESQRKAALQALIDSVDPDAPGEKLPLGDWRKGEIQIVGLERVISNRFWMEPEWKVLFPPKPGKTEPAEGTYRWIQWNIGVENGAAVLCITAGKEIVLVKEFKHAPRRWMLGIPRGLRIPGETLEQNAAREAEEEAGVKVTGASDVFDLGRLWPDTGALRSHPAIIAVTNVEVDEALRSRDVSESVMTNLVLPVERIDRLVMTGGLEDAFTEVAISRARLRGIL